MAYVRTSLNTETAAQPVWLPQKPSRVSPFVGFCSSTFFVPVKYFVFFLSGTKKRHIPRTLDEGCAFAPFYPETSKLGLKKLIISHPTVKNKFIISNIEYILIYMLNTI